MTITNQNFTMYEGDTKRLVIPVSDADGDPYPMDTAVLSWVLYDQLDAVSLVTKSTGSGITVDPVNTHIVYVALDADDTTDLGGSTYYHQLQAVIGLVVGTLVTGTVKMMDKQSS